MKTALTIRNAEVVLPVRTERTDVSVINGRICAIGNEIPNIGEVIDVDGLFLLPGIQEHAIVLPDGHEGYGFPVGGVAAMDAEEGMIIRLELLVQKL